MEQIDYTKYLPEPPAGMIKHVQQQGELQEEYLIYGEAWEYEPLEDRSYRVAEVLCTACGESFHARKVEAGGCSRGYGTAAPFGFLNPGTQESVIEGTTTLCPMCGEAVTAKHIRYARYGIYSYAWCASVHRIQVEGMQDRLMLCDWRLQRTVDREGRHAIEPWLWSAYVVEERKLVRIMGFCRNMGKPMPIRPTQRKSMADEFGKVSQMMPFSEDVLLGTTAENSKLDLYIRQGGKRLVGYLRLWRRHGNAENLITAGYGGLVDKLIERECCGGTARPACNQIDWREKRPWQMLHMERWQAKQIGPKLDPVKLEEMAWAQSVGLEIRQPEQLRSFLHLGGYQAKQLWEHGKPEEFWKNVRYLERDPKRTAGELTDYWIMAKKLKMDVEEPQIRWPKELKQAHDRAVERLNEQKLAQTLAEFTERAKMLAEFGWQENGILIRPCASEAELRQEGKALHHCVASYSERYRSGKTAIFFIRRVEEPNRPWFTLELDEKALEVRQNRGKYNCDREPEIVRFERNWLNWLRSVKKGANAA